MKKKLVYVSGPISDTRGEWFVKQNIHAAEQVAARLWQMGFSVICPHLNTAFFGGLVPYEDFIAADLVMVERSDLIVMTPFWRDSKGGKIEREHALKVGVPVYYYPEDSDKLARLAREQDVEVVAA